MKPSPAKALTDAAAKAKVLRQQLSALDEALLKEGCASEAHEQLIDEGGKALAELERVLCLVSPQRFGSVGISLGRADGIAKYFAFSFVATEKRSLASLKKDVFWGSGVYAIYYSGESEPAYSPLSGTETPIYVGKADPRNPYAESIEAQGRALHLRLGEHARTISKTKLDLNDFSYRAATIQTGMQAAVEEFMIRLFSPIWNKEIGVCRGFGKHGDSPDMRKHKRSPWDTMHSGRGWADKTAGDQSERPAIVARIARHFTTHPVIPDKNELMTKLVLR